jgi:hypothetical protein
MTLTSANQLNPSDLLLPESERLRRLADLPGSDSGRL